MYHKFCWEKENLKSLQKSAKRSKVYSGICAEKWNTGDDLYTTFMMQVMNIGDEGWIYILDGEMTGTVSDGIVIYPTEIIEEYHVKKVSGSPYPTIEILAA